MKLVDSQEELVGKKIVAIQLEDSYPMGYVIVEGGEFIAFEESSDSIEFINSYEVKTKLLYNKELREKLLSFECITQEECNLIAKQREDEIECRNKAIAEKEYKDYLRLKEKFDK